MTIGEVVKGSSWLYLGALIFNFLGFLFWVLASFFVPPSTIGTASAVIALESLLFSVFSIGTNVGVRRFIGLFWSKKDNQELSLYFSSALVFTMIVNLPIVCILFLSSQFSIGLLGLSSLELFYVAILLLLGFWPPIIYSLHNSILNTRATAIADIIFSLGKLLVGILLLYIGFDFVGILLAFIIGSLLRGLLITFEAARILRKNDIEFKLKFKGIIAKKIFQAGVVAWIPNMLTTFGQSLGILIIYGVVGGGETGSFYIAFAISLIIYRISDSIMMLMFPVLSGMSDGKKRAISTAIRFSLAATIPVAFIFVLYPNLLPALLGSGYSNVSLTLLILSLGSIIYPIISGYNSYIYAIGKYRHVIIIGLVITMVRLSLYLLLISPYEGLGIAIAYDIGLVVGLVPVILSSRITNYEINWKQYLKFLFIPSIIAGFLVVLNIQWLFGIPLILTFSIVSYTRFGIITKSDITEILDAFLSREMIAKIRGHSKSLMVILFGE